MEITIVFDEMSDVGALWRSSHRNQWGQIHQEFPGKRLAREISNIEHSGDVAFGTVKETGTQVAINKRAGVREIRKGELLIGLLSARAEKILAPVGKLAPLFRIKRVNPPGYIRDWSPGVGR